MEWVTIYLIIVTLAYLITGQCVTCTEVIRRDPGDNMTVTWSLGPRRGRDIIDIECERLTSDSWRHVFHCPEVRFCNYRFSHEHVGLATDPPFNSSDPYGKYLEGLGINIPNVSHTDAGLYRLAIDMLPEPMVHEIILYVYQEPTKPVITSTVQLNEVVLTCRSTPLSLPEEYRNTSQLEYTWNVNNIMDNYDIDDDKIRIISPRKANSGGLFSCKAREVNSKLTSQESDVFLFNSPYLENIEVSIHSTSDNPRSYLYSCIADCNPKCTYTWINAEGQIIVDGANMRVGSRNEPGAVTCRATNSLGTLSQKMELNINLKSDKQSGYPQTLVPSLAVLLVLTIGAVVVVGFLCFFLYRRRHGQTSKRDTDKNTKTSEATEGKNDAVDVNHEIVDELSCTTEPAYDQLDRSRDPPPRPNTYDVISMSAAQNKSGNAEDPTYEAV